MYKIGDKLMFVGYYSRFMEDIYTTGKYYTVTSMGPKNRMVVTCNNDKKCSFTVESVSKYFEPLSVKRKRVINDLL